MKHPSDGSARAMKADPLALNVDDRVEKKSAASIADEFQQSRQILIIAGSEISERILGDAFRANAYEVPSHRWQTRQNPRRIVKEGIPLSAGRSRQVTLERSFARLRGVFGTSPVISAYTSNRSCCGARQ